MPKRSDPFKDYLNCRTWSTEYMSKRVIKDLFLSDCTLVDLEELLVTQGHTEDKKAKDICRYIEDNLKKL